MTWDLGFPGAVAGSIFGPGGTVVGYAFASQFGVGVDLAYVPQNNTLYGGLAGTFAPLQIGGGRGFSLSYTPVPASQNANAIANGRAYSTSFQPLPIMGTVVTKSPGSGPPVTGFQVGTRAPVSFGVSHNVCLLGACGC
jgi:hypothetical protein